MRYFVIILSMIILFSCATPPTEDSVKGPVLVIHGGAGDGITPQNFPDSVQVLYKEKLAEALDAGYSILEKGGKALDAVEAAIRVLESSPLFNAGYGAVLTSDGKAELDASIMNGEDLNAGAVASVSTISHPITAARAVMEKSPHVLLVSKGAERFAANLNLEIVQPEELISPKRKAQWDKLKKKNQALSLFIEKLKQEKFGTVGAVALDKNGHLAAGTSTGGMMNKMPGRVGDSPIIGAGTYADDATCAISATGHGEYFIRLAIAHEISALMKHKNLSLKEAAHQVIFGELERLKGKGGIIGVDNQGHIAFEFNTNGMFRAYKDASGKTGIFFFGMDTDDVE